MSRREKRLKRRLLVPFEWLCIACALCVLPWLPRRGLFAVCDFLSSLMYAFDRRGRSLALQNLRILLGRRTNVEQILAQYPAGTAYDPTKAERTVVRRSYRNMARTVGYAFWTCVRAKERCAATGELDGPTKAFLAANRPAVTVSGHIGCWEILSQLAFLEGHRMMSVAKDIGTGGMTALLMWARRSIGQEIVPAKGAFKPLMQGLRDGKSIGLLVDQRVSPRKGGIWIRFAGVPMPVSAAPAFFAAKAKAPIIVAWSRPLRDGRYRCEFVDGIAADKARDIWSTTQRIAADIERIVRRHPSCWALNYKLFNRRPSPEEQQTLAAREQVERKGGV